MAEYSFTEYLLYFQEAPPAAQEDLWVPEQTCCGAGARQKGALCGGVQPLQAHLQQHPAAGGSRPARLTLGAASVLHAQRFVAFLACNVALMFCSKF